MACGRKCSPNPSPLPLPLPAMISSNVDHSLKHLYLFRFTVIAIAAFLCLIFILLFILTLLKRYKHNITRRRRTSSPVLFDINGGDSSFFDDDNENGASIMHPIWFINTVGLQQSIIDSIAMFKYRKEDNLVEGTECSVCLGEFQEDETLRMLPKCTHAFHVECIDTWLRSRKNCPLCRAPVIREDSVRHVQEFNGEARVDNLDDVGGDSFEVGGGESSTNELRVEDDDDDDDDDDEIVAIEEEEGCEVLDKDLGNNCEKMMRVNRSVSVHSYDPSSIFEVTSQEQYSYSLHSF